ncbi:MAG: SRPBCC domain-containing protein [Flavobacteriia bacterium]|nr:SRPBCC domain-containing protein [Flavobacteriia bacterium]
MDKIKFELEFLLKTSPRVLENMITTPAGLSEWFSDDVSIKDDVITFKWDSGEEIARLLSKKITDKIKWQWIEDEEEGIETYCELRYHIDPLTKVVVLNITDFAEEDEIEESKRLWEKQINQMKQTLGA